MAKDKPAVDVAVSGPPSFDAVIAKLQELFRKVDGDLSGVAARLPDELGIPVSAANQIVKEALDGFDWRGLRLVVAEELLSLARTGKSVVIHDAVDLA